MTKYFKEYESSYNKLQDNVEGILETIADRYMGTNPPLPFVFRASGEKAFRKESKYEYVFELNEIFKEANREQVVYAWAKLWSNEEKDASFTVTAYSPMQVFCNNNLVYKSGCMDERTRKPARSKSAKLSKGWNSVVIKFVKTALGFGGSLGLATYKYHPSTFFAPTPEREGQEGFIVTEPLNNDLELLHNLGDSEEQMNMKWLPEIEWNKEQLKKGQLERIYGLHKGTAAFGWVKANFNTKGTAVYTIKGECKSPIKIFIDDTEVYTSQTSGNFEKTIEVKGGIKDIIARSICTENSWGFKFEVLKNGQPVELVNAAKAKGTKDPWMYIGPFKNNQVIDINKIKVMDTLFECIDGKSYWKIDMPDMCIRPFFENNLFGKWNYPLGVTLYGLLQTGKVLNRENIVEYVKRHVELCTSFFEYSIWDREKFGLVGINTEICFIDRLDDCGSFASLMLELAKYEDVKNYRVVADHVADYISNKQSRLVDGAFYREISKEGNVGTMWVDDLYMSVPFLSRYYKLTGDEKYVNDAANQFLLFKKYMFMPEEKIMSHIYYTAEKLATEVPWGRGNGWVIFSLSELLAVLPENHEKRPELLKFFRELCEGYLALQDEDGMWHQVLNDHDSYQESSCTSMFAYAFARGVRFGFIEENVDEYIKSVFKAWEGLSKISIDQVGNIYGVCKGSSHSFSPRYYKYDLGWVLNDPHGTGIVMLAGIETLKLKQWIEG